MRVALRCRLASRVGETVDFIADHYVVFFIEDPLSGINHLKRIRCLMCDFAEDKELVLF